MSERDEATRLLQVHWAKRPIPVDPEEIAKNLGVRIIPGNALSLHGASGWYQVNKGLPEIFYNQSESKTRRRFTIAHELGHHVLGHGPRPRDMKAAFVDPYDPFEIAANRFAAELLMPVFAVKTLIENSHITSLSLLSAAFNVSESAMRVRLSSLGYI